jgi:hypothetical protein
LEMRTFLFATHWWWCRLTYGRVQGSVFSVQIRIATQTRSDRGALTAAPRC